jgi:GTPase SAR1 family protein
MIGVGDRRYTVEDLIGSGVIRSTKPITPVFRYNTAENQRLSVCITGPSGSGKSTLANQIVDNLAKETGYQVFLISVNKQEDVLYKKRMVEFDEDVHVYDDRGRLVVDQIDGPDGPEFVPVVETKRRRQPMYPVRIDYDDPEWRARPIEYYRDSIIIFDDIEDLGSKAANDWVRGLQSLILTAGRKLHIHIISTMHNFRDGSALTKLECEYWVFPLRGSPKYRLAGVLKDLMGMRPREAEALIKELGSDSRHVVIHTHYPSYIMSSHMIKLI